MSERTRPIDPAIDALPLFAVIAVFLYFSVYQIPSGKFAATATNSLGLFTGNFVYDTQWNLYFLFASVLIVEVVAFMYPGSKRRMFTFSFPVIIIGSAVVANWLVFQTPYVKPLYCLNCQVSGMSAVVSASVGTAFVVSLGTLVLLLRARSDWAEDEEDRKAYRRWLFRSLATSVASVAIFFLFLLSFFGGQSAATEFVHATSLLLGITLTIGVILMPAELRGVAATLAGSRKLFVSVLVLTVVVVGLTSPVYPVQYQTYQKGGWGGYVVFGDSNGSISAVTGEWVVPSVNCSATTKAAVLFWVGLDGWRSSTVEQGGTRADCFGGVAKYSAWYEFYPLEPSTMNFTGLNVSPGNLVRASVEYLGGSFNITVANLSTHKHTTVVGAYSQAARLDAEWIVEAPGYQNGTRLALPGFGQVRFNDTYAVVNGYSDSIGAAKNGTVLYYCTGSHFRLVPSTLGSEWTSFTLFSVDSAGC